MKDICKQSSIKSIFGCSGITVKNSPSLEHPIPVAVFYRNNTDGSVNFFWPKGNRRTALSKLYGRGSRMVGWALIVYRLCFDLGLEGILAHGKFVLFADLPTATYLQQQWTSDHAPKR